jgi:hypothetical protein
MWPWRRRAIFCHPVSMSSYWDRFDRRIRRN